MIKNCILRHKNDNFGDVVLLNLMCFYMLSAQLNAVIDRIR